MIDKSEVSILVNFLVIRNLSLVEAYRVVKKLYKN